MTAIVLAGGFGTRLRSVVSDVPKPMAPIKDKPFLTYIFDYLSRNSIDKAVLSVGYKYELIEEYFGSKYNGIDIVYSVEDTPLGTGGAIRKALSVIDDEFVFVLNGDTIFDIDLQDLEKQFKKNDSKLVLSLKPVSRNSRYGSVEIDSENTVTAFIEKKESGDDSLINGGVYLARSDIFNSFDMPEKFSFEDFMQNHFDDLKAAGVVFDGYFIDIGIPEDFERANREL